MRSSKIPVLSTVIACTILALAGTAAEASTSATAVVDGPTSAVVAFATADQPSVPMPPISLTPEQNAEVVTELSRFGVDADTRALLIGKLANGGGWDNMAGGEPATTSNEVVDGVAYSVSRFPDGSFVAAGIEEGVPAGAGARAIQGCATSGTSAGVSYRTNCTIIVTNGVTSGQFVASYSNWSTGTSIYNIGSGTINSDVGVATANGFSSSTAPGTTRWTQFNWTTVIDGWYQASRYVRLTVTTSGGNSSASF